MPSTGVPFRTCAAYTELTERTLTSRPPELLAAVQQIREQDWGIALDDVGADERSLALMPLVRTWSSWTAA